jgi:hypothetical protein
MKKRIATPSRNPALRDQTSMTQSIPNSHQAHDSVAPSLPRLRRTTRALGCAALLLGVAGRASAQDQSIVESEPSNKEETAGEPPAAGQPSAPVPETSSNLSPEQSRALWPLTWKKSPGQGFAFGLEEGFWGNSWGQGLRVTLPFSSNFATTVRGIYLLDMAEGPITVDAGARIDLVGRSEVLFNVMRLYGGGGVQVIAPVKNTAGKEVRVGGGGHFGFEFFCNPYYSFFLEVGGQGGTVSPGATVLAGMMFYPWTR